MADEASGDNAGDVFVYTAATQVIPNDVTRVEFHPPLTRIPERAFEHHPTLEEVTFCGELDEIGKSAFRYCRALRKIKFLSSVITIMDSSFDFCECLEEVVLHQGLQEIKSFAFRRAGEMASNSYDVILPESVKFIGEGAFIACPNLSSIHLQDGVESIGEFALCSSRFATFRLPQLITTIPKHLIDSCESLFCLELPENTTQIGYSAFSRCSSLRNLAIPPGISNSEIGGNVFQHCTDLLQLFGAENTYVFELFGSDQRTIIDALKHRFDGLPIHKMLYYQSYNSVTVKDLFNATNLRSGQRRSLRTKLDSTGRQQDCLGMTPLHILSCSSVQDLALYQTLIESYPENLISEDRWGALPLLYAIWGNAPSEILQFLVESYKSIHPNYEIDWSKMVAHLGRWTSQVYANQNLLELQQEHFPELSIDWNRVLTPNYPSKSLKFLTEWSMTKRINAIGVRRFRLDMAEWLKRVPDQRLNPHAFKKGAWLSHIRSALTHYESEYMATTEATFILELTLWKAKIGESQCNQDRSIKRLKTDESTFRNQCRISCGADVVIKNVLQYVLPGDERHPSFFDESQWYDSDSDSSSDGEDSSSG